MENNLSYASTPTTKPVLYKTYADMVKQWAELYPDKDAFVEYTKDGERKSLSCSELLSRATKFGKYLVRSGLERGNVVVICMKNSLNMVTALCGVYFCGGIVSCVSASLQDGSDVINHLRGTRAKVFIVDNNQQENGLDTKKVVFESAKDLHLHRLIYNCSGGVQMQGDLLTSFQDALKNDLGDEISFPDVLPEDTAVYFRTSGSSGQPKLVAHPHFTWVDNTRILNEQLGLDAKSIYFCDRPFGWGAGSPRTYFASAATRVFLDTSLTVGEDISDTISDIIQSEACTHAYLPGYLVADLLGRPDLKHKFTSLENVICSGERIPKTHGQLIGQFCRRLSVWYGSTEMNGVAAYISNDPSTFEDGIIGLPSPGVEIKLVDSRGNVVQKGEHGELYARNKHRFSSYVGMPEKFHGILDASNWFHSGDTGYIRQDGNFVLAGRTSEQITIATSKVFPFDIEKELLKCPGISAAIVVPVPDVRLTNAICACVILDKVSARNLDSVKEFCLNTWMESSTTTGISLRPKYYLEFEKFLTNTNGKLDRKLMTQEARKMLKL